jgi:myo-inositol-1(or 4)-monophosphatase
MSIQALLNVNQIAARKGASELEFAVKKVHSLDASKGGPDGYLKAIIRRVEGIVIEEIRKFYPEDNFLGAESGSEVNNSNITWVLKAIDGETNFINGYPHFALSLCSLIDEVPSTAVIIDPLRREEFSASKGSGADLNNGKIRVSKQQGLSGSMVSFFKNNETKEDYSYDFDKTYKEIANQDLSIRTSGSVALDLAYISTGRLDAIWAHGAKLWDVAAGLLIAQESGALISNFNGDPKYLDGDHFICSSPKVYKSILKSVKPYFKTQGNSSNSAPSGSGTAKSS